MEPVDFGVAVTGLGGARVEPPEHFGERDWRLEVCSGETAPYRTREGSA